MAFFGALITIVALAIDPFSQQVITYTFCSRPSDDLTASVAVASYYDRYVGAATTEPTTSLDLQMANAMYAGLLSSPANASAPVPFTCSSGNCTFPSLSDTNATHMSLAMCGECEDVSNSIIKTHSGGATFYTLPDPGNIAGISGPPVSISTNDDSALDGMDFHNNWLAFNSYSFLSNNSTQEFLTLESIMFRHCSCSYTDSEEVETECSDCERFAARCEVFPCVKTYHAQITNFVLSEKDLSRQRLSVFGDIWQTWTERILHRGQWVHCNSTDPGCVWQYSAASAVALGNTLTWSGSIGAMFQYNDPSSASGLPWLMPLFNSGNGSLETLQTHLDGFTHSLTAVIRQYGNASNAIKPVGTTWLAETCIDVKWAWLSLPATLLLFAIIFLSLTIWKMENRQVALWKSSPLPLLFHGIGQELKEPHDALEEVGDMKVAARSISARLDQQSGRWFVTTETVSSLVP